MVGEHAPCSNCYQVACNCHIITTTGTDETTFTVGYMEGGMRKIISTEDLVNTVFELYPANKYKNVERYFTGMVEGRPVVITGEMLIVYFRRDRAYYFSNEKVGDKHYWVSWRGFNVERLQRELQND